MQEILRGAAEMLRRVRIAARKVADVRTRRKRAQRLVPAGGLVHHLDRFVFLFVPLRSTSFVLDRERG